VFSVDEFDRLRGFPVPTRPDLIRYFTLSPADVEFVAGHRGMVNRLGVAVQLCTLWWLGFVPDRVSGAPIEAVVRLAEVLGCDPDVLTDYGEREQTRTDHLARVVGYAGWTTATVSERKGLDEFLFARALEHDSPRLLFTAACEYLRVVRPGWQQRPGRLPRDHGRLAALEDSIGHVRKFAPRVLTTVGFNGGIAAQELLSAVTILTGLYRNGVRHVPDRAPVGFVPARWQEYLDRATATGHRTAYRHYWELCVLLALRDGLRSGDVFVPGSRRYSDPTGFLLNPTQWASKRSEFCALVGKPAEPADALAELDSELHMALADLEEVLARNDAPGDVRIDEHGEPVIPRTAAAGVPDEVGGLRDELTRMLPHVTLASILVELDQRIGLFGHLDHAGGVVNRPADLHRNLIYVVLAQATNMGLTAMARACGVSYETLAWTAEWYLREDTLRAANTALINYHHQLPGATAFGPGTLSSSDGQRFPTRGHSLTARHFSRYFARGQGISSYTHVSDQHTTFATRVIPATASESHYVLDDVLGNDTDLPNAEHSTDTHGATLANFALFDLVGLRLSPRIRDLGKITLCRTGPKTVFTSRYFGE
jgi:TnpA family transposase